MNTIRLMIGRSAWSAATCWGVFALLAVGCRSFGRTDVGSPPSSSHPSRSGDIHGVVCLFDQKPWISVDAAGDPDPEGLRYRVFLDPGKGKCVLRDGSFRIELYQIDRAAGGEAQRTLVSDWNYPTSELGTILSKILGKGYHIQLRWAKKDTAGHEIEVVTQFIDRYGNATRSPTKRLRVPKYSS